MNLEEVDEGIWKVKGGGDGPTLAFLGGVHGNELTGIACIKKLRDEIEAGKVKISAGTLYLILGNLKAMKSNTRTSESGKDLNRCFTKDVLDQDVNGVYEMERAQKIAKVLKTVDASFDIHSTNKPSEPMVLSNVTERHKALYKWLPAKHLLTDPEFVLGNEPVTTDEFTNESGGVGLAYESGQTTDLTKVEVVYEVLLNLLRNQGILQDGVSPQPPTQNLQHFKLAGKILLTDKGFRFAEGKGEASFEGFKKGDTLAYIGDTPYKAEYDGVFLFPKIKEHWGLGKPTTYFATEFDPEN